MTRSLILLAAWLAALTLRAQSGQETRVDWADFIDSYFDETLSSAAMLDEPTDEGDLLRQLERLEQLHHEPINLNTATRRQLGELPFLGTAAIDSILAYRQRNRHFLTLGELQFVRPLTYRERQYLSLFTYAGDTLAATHGWTERLTRGHHELRLNTDVPLYRREGYRPEAKESGNGYYGSPVAHSIRYRYAHADGTAYGLALAQDAGEPFARGSNHPYDYTSAYMHLALLHERVRLWLGDYEVAWGEGLLMGKTQYGGRTQLFTNRMRAISPCRVHSSMAEYGYARGIAAETRLGRRCDLLVFASYRRVDGHPDGDTITSLTTSGLHRTQSECNAQRALGVGMGGARLACRLRHGTLGVGGYAAFFDKPVWPRMQDYNRYYLRGKSAGGVSADFVCETRRWNYRAECAVDARFNAATSHTLRMTPASLPWTFILQGRWLSPRYVAPYARIMQMASRVQNELGGLLGAEWRPLPSLTLTSYAEYAYHRRPLYRVSRPSHRMTGMMQGEYAPTRHCTIDLRYIYKMTQRDVSGHDGVIECIHNHSCRLSAHLNHRHYALHLAADFRMLQSQTKPPQWGQMLSARGIWRCNKRFQCHTMAALFHTDSYDTRLYAYEPQLQGAGGFPTFAYHGARWVVMTRWLPFRTLSIALRYGGIRYFNRKTISSGPALIHSPIKNDLSVQLLWHLNAR